MPDINLPSLDGQRNYMVVRNIDDDHSLLLPRATPPYECYSRQLDTEQCEHIGNALSIVRYEQDDIRIQAQHYRYKVKCDSNGNYYVADMQTRQRNVLYNEDPYSIKLALAFSVNPTVPLHITYMRELLNYKNMLYNAFDVYDTTPTAIIQMLAYHSNNLNKIDKDHVSISLTGVNITDNINLHAYINHTYVNTVYNCEQMCLQSSLSNSHSFTTGMRVAHDGLLCTHRILEVAEMLAHGIDVYATNNTQNINCNVTALQPHVLQNTQNITISILPPLFGGILAACSILSMFVAHSNAKFPRAIRKKIRNITLRKRAKEQVHEVHENTIYV